MLPVYDARRRSYELLARRVAWRRIHVKANRNLALDGLPKAKLAQRNNLLLALAPWHTHPRTLAHSFCNCTKLGEAMEFLLGLAIGTSLGACLGVLVVAWLRACKDESSGRDYAKPDRSALGEDIL
ncbi:hypothetical protein [Paraburkholderia caffeinilytica]|uniref:Uncharacterized protein n=1 Tax=Paraburkholderia caffeinilytica TaxID=1761016 RepID=A0ABQ1MHZ7_9BURK|nr:hypothetical protein [Paraburkholderia caffeinilytica]GGC41016.1 hypothetical protein GCM10011400_29720 [Paraburkholderia caffeinilytica]CAB3787602.1 hypothetical protein LMG28690_02478 [Paraburkholderia caffeinilytica]